jgi:hypothetical protein
MGPRRSSVWTCRPLRRRAPRIGPRRSSPAWMCRPPRSRASRMVPQRSQAYDECAGQDPDAFEDLLTAKDGDVRMTDLRSRTGEG